MCLETIVVPPQPWDQTYLDKQDPPLKHLSFHCYCRKLTSGVDKCVLGSGDEGRVVYWNTEAIHICFYFKGQICVLGRSELQNQARLSRPRSLACRYLHKMSAECHHLGQTGWCGKERGGGNEVIAMPLCSELSSR